MIVIITVDDGAKVMIDGTPDQCTRMVLAHPILRKALEKRFHKVFKGKDWHPEVTR